MMENLRQIIRESILQVLKEVNQVPAGVVDANGKPIRTGRMARPIDKNDKRWGQIAGVTIELKVRINWSDPTSKHSGQIKGVVDPKTIEMY